MKEVMDVVVKTVNKIRANLFSHRQFKLLLTELDTEYDDVLLYSRIRWLSRGKVLERFFYIIQEIDVFFIQKCEQIIVLSDPKWINDLAFLVDITRYLKELNTKLQGKDQLITDLFSHINALKVKLLLFKIISKMKTLHTSIPSKL
jgi:hypothetical protein